MEVVKVEDITQTVIDSIPNSELRDRLVSITRWMRLFGATYVDMKGNTKVWSFASRKKIPLMLSEGKESPDAVIIIPIHKSAEGNRLVVTKEFRIPIDSFEWGFPAGLIDADEEVEVAAARELKEETGLTLTKVLHKTKSAISSAGLSDESVQYVIVECEGELNKDLNESSENIEAHLFSLEDIEPLLESKDRVSAKAIPYLLMFNKLGKICW